MRRPRYADVVATLALFIALGGVSWAAVTLPSNSVGAKQLRRSAVTSRAVRNGSVASVDLSKAVRRKLAAARQGPIGPSGPAGAQGTQGERGLNVAGSRQLPNVNDFACNTEVVVGSLPLTIPEASQIWTHAEGSIDTGASDVTEDGVRLRLRDAGDSTTLATSIRQWSGRLSMNMVSTFAPGGLLLAGNNSEGAGTPYLAPAGKYILQTAVLAQGGPCAAAKPRFGWNQGQSMSYLLVGAG